MPGYIKILLTFLVAFGPFSIDMYLPTLPDIAKHFSSTEAQVQLTLASFSIGFAFAMLLFGLLSDRFGRKAPLLLGLVVYTLASFACAFAQTLDQLIAFRFVQGVGACCGPVIGRAIIRDLLPREEAAKVLSLMTSAMAIAPALAPFAGSALAAHYSWTSNFYVMAILGGCVFIAASILLKESIHQKDHSALSLPRIANNVKVLFSSRHYLACASCNMLTFGAMFCFISSAPILLISIMGLTPATFGFGFGAVVLGYMIGGVISSRLIGRLSPVQMILSGILVVFSGAILGLICNQIGFDRLEILCASMFIVYFGAAMIMPSSAVEALQAFPRMAGFASSVVGCSQFAFAALVASVLGSIHMQHTLPFYLFIMGLASALCLVFVLHFRKLLHAQKAEEKNMRAAE